MNSQRGYTVIELIVASAIMIAVMGVVLGVLHDILLRTPVLEEATDLQQRSRVTFDTLASEIKAAGAGAEMGPLSAFFATLIPRRPSEPATSASATAITIRYAPAAGARSRLAQSLPPDGVTAVLTTSGACARNAVACGFTAGTTAALVDDSGQADIVSVNGVASGALTLTDLYGQRTAAYPAGAQVLEVVEVAYFWDPAARQLRREQHGVSFAAVENVTQVAFSYLGSSRDPTAPVPPTGTANCLYAADGTPLIAPAAEEADPLVAVPLSVLSDGPFCASGRMMFDRDLLRVRAVRVSMRLETSVDALRGRDARFFARPGTATGPRVIADVASTVDFTLRSIGR